MHPDVPDVRQCKDRWGTVFMLKLIRVLSKLLIFDFVLLATTTLLAVSRKNRQYTGSGFTQQALRSSTG